MHILINSDIEIRQPSKELQQWCDENLVLPNPDFYKKERLGKWTGGTPRNLYLYEKWGDILYLPFGCIRNIWHLIKDSEYELLFKPIRSFDYHSNINLYPYQEKAVTEALRQKNGILVMPCGSGKTQSGLEIIARLGGKALWLTHTSDLLNQSKRRAEQVLNDVGVGTITEGRVKIGEGITFATVQTMSRLDLIKYQNCWDIIIVDECQHCAGTPTRVTQFYKVVTNLNARYKIGLTATPYRADGLDQAMFAVLGGIIHEVSREEVADTTCPIIVMQLHSYWKPHDDVTSFDGTIDYNKVIDSMIHDEERLNYVSFGIGYLQGPIMVLANRVEYLDRLQKIYPNKSVCLSGGGSGKQAKADRKEALRKLNEGEIQCVFATYQLAKEGLDVPNLKYVVLATPEKDETTVIQSAGRVGRKAEGKQHGTVIDFCDDFPMYKTWAKKRAGYYKKIGATIIEQKGGT